MSCFSLPSDNLYWYLTYSSMYSVYRVLFALFFQLFFACSRFCNLKFAQTQFIINTLSNKHSKKLFCIHPFLNSPANNEGKVSKNKTEGNCFPEYSTCINYLMQRGHYINLKKSVNLIVYFKNISGIIFFRNVQPFRSCIPK